MYLFYLYVLPVLFKEAVAVDAGERRTKTVASVAAWGGGATVAVLASPTSSNNKKIKLKHIVHIPKLFFLQRKNNPTAFFKNIN